MSLNSPITSHSSTTTTTTTTITNNNSSTTAVQVALRVRPLTSSDRLQPRFSNSTNSDVIKTFEKSIAIVPHQKTFQFDYVFDTSSTQEQVFTSVASNLVDKFIDGYNVTILAYGQTSSGKTYTMGTAMDNEIGANPEQEGIIPRAMSALFQKLDNIRKESTNKTQGTSNKRGPSALSAVSGLRVPKRSSSTGINLRPVSMITPPRRGLNNPTVTQSSPDAPFSGNNKTTRYTVHVSFIEIYNEELIDLLNPAPPSERTPVTIREDTKGHIIWTGIKEVPVGSTEDVLRFLQMGTENRATGSTDMNAKSSRSHAIFSVTLKQEKWVPSNNSTSTPIPKSPIQRHSSLNVKALIGQMEKQSKSAEEENEDGEWMTVNSKFHFVDLAGSERLKRTAAEGDRRKEGININAGLLALGNVISALASDPNSPRKSAVHIPYRDSKLTRLLQDSLGGNATTLMIACISPAEINLTETVNTVKYAYRARSIRNKAERNETEEWMTTDNIDQLRQIISKLKVEVKSLKGANANQRGSPSPSSFASGGSPKPFGTQSFSRHHGIMSPSSSLSDNDPNPPSTYPSMSATTNLTMPDSSTSMELCDAQNPYQLLHHNQNEVADLRRQIEELQNEVTVTRERNYLVEKELRQQQQIPGSLTPDSVSPDNEFQHLVEPVIEEYEKSISGLESQLALARAALSHSDQALGEQQAKIEEYEALQSSEIQILEDLKARLSVATEREHSSESYCMELESQLERAVAEGQKDQQILSELRDRIVKFKEMDEQTEQYIDNLENRLSASELERNKLVEKIAALAGAEALVSVEKEDEPEKEIRQKQHAEEKEELLKELSHYQWSCQELEQELVSLKEAHNRTKESLALAEAEAENVQKVSASATDQSTQSEPYEDEKVSELTLLLDQKEAQVNLLESRLEEIQQMKAELALLRQSHVEEIDRIEADLAASKSQCHEYQIQLTGEQERSQSLQNIIDSLEKSSDDYQCEIKQAKSDYAELLAKEQATQASLSLGLQELEKVKHDLNALQMVEEKQDAIIHSLDMKLEEMDRLVLSLQTQLEERDSTIEQLQAENATKAEAAISMQKQLKNILKDVCGIGSEKKQLEQVMQFMEGTLRLHDAKSKESLETLEDIKHYYKAHEKEIEEKERTVSMLSVEKEELSLSLNKLEKRVSQDSITVETLSKELNKTHKALTEQSNLVKELELNQEQLKIETQHMQTLEARVQELSKAVELYKKTQSEKEEELNQLEKVVQKQLVQNEELTKTIAELEDSIKRERSLASSQDNSGMIAELEKQLSILQEAKASEKEDWKIQLEKVQEELDIAQKEGREYSSKMQVLQTSLDEAKKKLQEKQYKENSSSTETSITEYAEKSDDSEDDSEEFNHDIRQLCNESKDTITTIDIISPNATQNELLETIMQLKEDNDQLIKINDDLESQLVLQRSQLTLEAKNLELELMKLTAAKDRLEKEMEQVIPRSTNGSDDSSRRESMQFSSPPYTPRVLSPPPTTSQSTGSIIQHKLHRDISMSNMSRLSKSGSYRSVSSMLFENSNHMTSAEEDALKRMSMISMKSDFGPIRPTSSIRSSSTIVATNVPPLTAPPSNPLPPIPSPLPALPSSPTNSLSNASEPVSPLIQPIVISSEPSLYRKDSTNSASFSEIMNASAASNFTGDQYDKLIRSLQRKAQFAENDVRAHQEVISKLESQLSKSETSVREVKRQLDLLSKEKLAHNLEIQNLRTQVNQIQSQQKDLTDESINERKELEEKLEAQKDLKEKAEKARRILENRMDELMNKKSKFMCF